MQSLLDGALSIQNMSEREREIYICIILFNIGAHTRPIRIHTPTPLIMFKKAMSAGRIHLNVI